MLGTGRMSARSLSQGQETHGSMFTRKDRVPGPKTGRRLVAAGIVLVAITVGIACLTI